MAGITLNGSVVQIYHLILLRHICKYNDIFLFNIVFATNARIKKLNTNHECTNKKLFFQCIQSILALQLLKLEVLTAFISTLEAPSTLKALDAGSPDFWS